MKFIGVIMFFTFIGMETSSYVFIPSTVYKDAIKSEDSLNYKTSKLLFSSGFKDSISVVYKDTVIFNEYIESVNGRTGSFCVFNDQIVENKDTVKILFHEQKVYTFLQVNYNY